MLDFTKRQRKMTKDYDENMTVAEYNESLKEKIEVDEFESSRLHDEVVEEVESEIAELQIREVGSRKNEIYWEGEILVVKTRSGTIYRLEEQQSEVVENIRASCIRRERQRNGQIEESIDEVLAGTKLFIKSCISPKLNEDNFDFKKLKGSESMALQRALNELYDMGQFL